MKWLGTKVVASKVEPRISFPYPPRAYIIPVRHDCLWSRRRYTSNCIFILKRTLCNRILLCIQDSCCQKNVCIVVQDAVAEDKTTVIGETDACNVGNN